MRNGDVTVPDEARVPAEGSYHPTTALVLSGGGARGAYAVGVVAALNEILGGLRAKLQIFTGTSVGAINAAHFASCAHRNDLGVAELVRRYESLRLRTHLRPHLGGLRKALVDGGRRPPPLHPTRHGLCLLDPTPFEEMVCHEIPWARLHRNIEQGLVHALIVSGLRISDGRTTTFAELAPDTKFVFSHDPRRDAVTGTISADHVLASAALPLLFPARRIGTDFYCDGGLRFNTPMAPAIRAGAERLVVIALRAGKRSAPGSMVESMLRRYPKPFFLLGKVLDALLLDPIEYDLHVLDRLNRLVEVMEETMAPPALDRIQAVLEKERGLPYAQIQTLVFRPSEDIGVLAGDYMRSEQPTRREAFAARTFLRHAGALGEHVEADFVSYLLFDGGFARRLIELGYRDARARADEIRRFFAPVTAPIRGLVPSGSA